MESKNQLRVPLGTRDLDPKAVAIRDKIFNIAKNIFTKRDCVQIDTPIIELYSLVQNLYGEEFNKLVYELDDSNNDKLILRYDLTVPLARYVAMNSLKLFRRFQYSKVYRKDTPQISKGRYREFLQLDLDFVGDDQGSRIFDIEMLDTLSELLTALLGDKYVINLNDKKVLLSLCKSIGVTEQNDIITVSGALDKLDKKTWDEIRKELKLDKEIIDKLDQIVTDITKILETKDMKERNKNMFEYMSKYMTREETQEIQFVFDALERLNILNNFMFNPLLARGLDYYTGLIYEAVYLDKEIMNNTIAAGGRYDKMIGKFSNAGDVPAIGMSLGVERIATIIEKTEEVKTKEPDVYIASVCKSQDVNIINMINIEKLRVCSQLRRLGVYAILTHLKNPKMASQLETVFEKNIKYMVVIGENEIKKNTLSVKDIKQKIQKELPYQEALNFISTNLS
jgi:histidyl-tRNA synthetase